MPAKVDHRQALAEAQAQMRDLKAAIRSTSPDRFKFRAPIIDRQRVETGGWQSDEVRGLRKFEEGVDNYQRFLQTVAESNIPPREDPMPNVQAFTTAWKQICLAEPPVSGVKISMKGKEKAQHASKESEGFVDVIARGGLEWIRIFSKKQSQLLSELREADSYINSDYDSDSDLSEDTLAGPSRSSDKKSRAPVMTNSLRKTVESLLSILTTVERIPGAEEPKLTLRITRIAETGHPDERITDTIEWIKSKGVNLVFGDLSEYGLEPGGLDDGVSNGLSNLSLDTDRRDTLRGDIRPSFKINLDPTALMGLCSDLLHHPLPTDEEGAKKRFFRPPWALKAEQGGRDIHSKYAKDGDDDWFAQSQNSRELAKNCWEEMEIPLIEEIRDTIQAAIDAQGPAAQGLSIEFWATEEAITYLKETLGSEEVVGHGLEQRRMKRLIGLEDGDFFEGSRYEGIEGCLRGLRVKVFPQVPRPGGQGVDRTSHNGNSHETAQDVIIERLDRINLSYEPLSTPQCTQGTTSFHHCLASVAKSCLASYRNYLRQPNAQTYADLPNFLKPSRLPVPKLAQLSLPFPIVSLISLARGSEEGTTSLMMGNVILRDLWAQNRWKVKGWSQGNYELERKSGRSWDNAAVWMLPYRSLGEGKRVKFEHGDFSYPIKELD